MNIFLVSNKNSIKPADFHVGSIKVHESDLCVIKDGGIYSVCLIGEEPRAESSWDEYAHIKLEDSLSEYQDGFALFFENTKKRCGNKKILRELIGISQETELTKFLENALDILLYNDDRWNVSYIKGLYRFFKRSSKSDKEAERNVDSTENIDNYETRLYHAERIESDNPDGAFLIYKELAEKGCAEAQYRLGKCYRLSIGVQKDPVKELYWFKAAAEEGHVDAQFRLAKLYEKSFTPDYMKAFIWYKKAAEQGEKKAISELITCYKYGRGTEKDMDQASFWQSKLGGEEQNVVVVSPLEKKAVVKEEVKKNDSKSKTQYERAIELLVEGTSESLRNAFVLLNRIVVTQGDANAIYKLGNCYETGTGTEQSYQKAFKYYEMASSKGLTEAHLSMAYFYLYGRYVEKSKAEAYVYFKKAADKGNSKALYEIAQFYENGIYVQQSKFKAKSYYKDAADKGHAAAAYRYAQLIEADDIQSLIVKLDYLEKACCLGVTKSVIEVEKVRKNIEVLRENKKQAEKERQLKEQEILKKIEKEDQEKEQKKNKSIKLQEYKFYEILKQHIKINSYLATDSIVELFSDIYGRYPKEFREAKRKYEKKYKESIYSLKNVRDRKLLKNKEERKSLLIEYLQEKGYKYIDNTDKGGVFWILEDKSAEITYLKQNGISVIFKPQGGKCSGHKPSWLVSY